MIDKVNTEFQELSGSMLRKSHSLFTDDDVCPLGKFVLLHSLPPSYFLELIRFINLSPLSVSRRESGVLSCLYKPTFSSKVGFPGFL
jgi:hypothetical protein